MTQERVDVLIVVALRPELDTLLAEGEGGRTAWREAIDGSGATYHVRETINAHGQTMRLAAAWLGDSGQATATMRSRRLVDELDPLCLAMCGVCVGRRGSVHLGDVIVAERVFDLAALEAQDDDASSPASVGYELDLTWRMNAAALAADDGWRTATSYWRWRPPTLDAQKRWLLHAIFDVDDYSVPPAERPERKERCPNWTEAMSQVIAAGDVLINDHGTPSLTENGYRRIQREKALYPDGLPSDPPFWVHLGALATASKVIKDADVLNRLTPRVRRLLGADLESTAIASVATHLARHWFVVRGVADYADDETDYGFVPFARHAAASFLLTYLHRYFDVGARARPPSDRPKEVIEPLLVERLTLNGFKNVSELTIDLDTGSRLGGRWTCLAGINGSGKTSILQAIALVLLGDKLAEQLGSERLKRMVRQGGDATSLAEITVRVRVGAEVQDLSLPLSAEGVDSKRFEGYAGHKEMRALWEKRARRGILAAYGASRNLAEYLDNRHVSLHPDVQGQMTLFEPLSRVARAGLLLSEDPALAPVIGTLRRLLAAVLADLPVAVAPGEGSLRFAIDGTELPASALPDGFRSSIAWLGDLCALWHEKARPEDVGDGDPKRIHGVVLVDEIDLHLHPSLQRVLVPRLREAMPRVQWIVTTHSPLVLAGFDRREIKMLDSREPGGVRELDRDILGFSTDQIYDWLMDTRPRGVVLESMLAEAEAGTADPARGEELAVLVATAPDFSEEDAKKRVAWRRGLLERLRKGTPPGDEKS
jgi:nucleoside phosphorylase